MFGGAVNSIHEDYNAFLWSLLPFLHFLDYKYSDFYEYHRGMEVNLSFENWVTITFISVPPVSGARDIPGFQGVYRPCALGNEKCSR